MEEQPLPAFRPTPPLPGQEFFLYNQVILTKELNGVLALCKVISSQSTDKGCHEDFKRALPTNDVQTMKIGYTGKWFAIRRPETDTEGLVDIVKIEGDEEKDFFGEDLDAER